MLFQQDIHDLAVFSNQMCKAGFQSRDKELSQISGIKIKNS